MYGALYAIHVKFLQNIPEISTHLAYMYCTCTYLCARWRNSPLSKFHPEAGVHVLFTLEQRVLRRVHPLCNVCTDTHGTM